jgi:hypothetical protein
VVQVQAMAEQVDQVEETAQQEQLGQQLQWLAPMAKAAPVWQGQQAVQVA